jgi:hypothetical protein
MAKRSKRQHESMDATKRGALKKAKAGDLLAKADRMVKGGVAVERDLDQPSMYQHNQTNLEFLR